MRLALLLVFTLLLVLPAAAQAGKHHEALHKACQEHAHQHRMKKAQKHAAGGLLHHRAAAQ
jgi:hypothetical protein